MLGEKLMKLRKRQGLSQQEVADTLGVTRQTVSNWECDQGAPALDKAKELADLFHISLNDLVSDEIEVVCASDDAPKEVGDYHVLMSLKGKRCKIECDNYEWMMMQGSSREVDIIDVDAEWVRVSYQRAKDGVSLTKKETVTQLIDLSSISMFTLCEAAS